VNNTIDAAYTPAPTPCTANAGTLSGGGNVTTVAGQAPVNATANGDEVIPA